MIATGNSVNIMLMYRNVKKLDCDLFMPYRSRKDVELNMY